MAPGDRAAVHTSPPRSISPARPGRVPATASNVDGSPRAGAHVARSLAKASSVRLAVRGRAGPGEGRIVIAFPWRRRDAAEALARQVAAVMGDLLGTRRSFERLVADAAETSPTSNRGPLRRWPIPRSR